MSPERFQRHLIDRLQGMQHIVVNRQAVEQAYPVSDRSLQEQFVEDCQKTGLHVSTHNGTGNYLVAWQQ